MPLKLPDLLLLLPCICRDPPSKLSCLYSDATLASDVGGAVFADFGAMPKSQLAVVPSQGHVSLMMQTKTILGFLEIFLK
jgi:hypothetical protein